MTTKTKQTAPRKCPVCIHQLEVVQHGDLHCNNCNRHWLYVTNKPAPDPEVLAANNTPSPAGEGRGKGEPATTSELTNS